MFILIIFPFSNGKFQCILVKRENQPFLTFFFLFSFANSDFSLHTKCSLLDQDYDCRPGISFFCWQEDEFCPTLTSIKYTREKMGESEISIRKKRCRHEGPRIAGSFCSILLGMPLNSTCGLQRKNRQITSLVRFSNFFISGLFVISSFQLANKK